MADLDPRFTFEEFVIGPANRLASAAARRAAENPGASYNPLFVYSASGLGKTHMLGAIAHHATKLHSDTAVVYETLEGFLGGLTVNLEQGGHDGLTTRYEEMDILLMDDVQFLAGQPEAQEMLLRLLDGLTGEGQQVVLASDRPPAEIDGLGSRLRSRFEGGLLVDIGSPEYETRVAIVRKKAEVLNQELASGVAEIIGRIGFKNVRELGGALNKVVAIQDLEDRVLPASEVRTLLGVEEEDTSDDAEVQEFLSDLSGTVAAQVEAREAPWRVSAREAAEELEAAGLKADRLRQLLEKDAPPSDIQDIVARFREGARRLEEVRNELDEVGNPWPEAAHAMLRDPDRLSEAETLLASAKERARAFPEIPPGPPLEGLGPEFPPLVLRAAGQLLGTDRPEYSPLYVWSSDPGAARALLAATGRTYASRKGSGSVAFVSVSEFASEFIDALSDGVAGAWRERWWSSELLLVHGTEDFARTEQAQDEFFHLFEALQRRRARVMVAADRPPAALEGINDRLRSRFEGGLVLEVEVESERISADALVPDHGPASGVGQAPTAESESEDVHSMDREWIQQFQPARGGAAGGDPGTSDEGVSLPAWRTVAEEPEGLEEPPLAEKWFPTKEIVCWQWEVLEDRIVEEPD